MTKRTISVFALGLLLLSAAVSADVVVLRGGVVIQLKQPPVRQGKNVLLTRADGTLLSVPATEIDAAATAAARGAQAAPAAPPPAAAAPPTLAEAARAAREVPKARVRITDADVSHNESAAQSQSTAAGGSAEAAAAPSAGAGRIEVGDYNQEKSGDAIVVRGTLRNPGSTTAINVRMTVTALGRGGDRLGSTEAGISAGAIEPGKEVAFSATLPVGGKPVGSLRFEPRWISSEPPQPAAGAAGSLAAGTAAAAAPASGATGTAAAPATTPATAPPPPAPTPFGRGSLYAPPAPNAPAQAPADGRSGYLPGASHPSNQPKPPN